MSLTEQIVIVNNNTDNVNSISTLDGVGTTLMFPKQYMDDTHSILINDYDNDMDKRDNLTAIATNGPNDTHSTGHSTGCSTPDLYDANFPSLSSTTSTTSSSSPPTTTINYSSIVNSRDHNNKGAVVTETLELAASQHNNPQQQKRSKSEKNQAAEIIRRVMERTNTKINVDPGAKSSVVTFLIEGKYEDVANANRILTDKLGLKDEITIQVPVSARSHLLGPRGATLKLITNTTGAHITLPPRSKNPREEQMGKFELDYDEDEEMMNVTIFGEMCAVCKAKVEIQDIIKSMCTTKRTHYIKHIESKFYPLIAGAHNQRINQFGLDTGTKIHVPSYNSVNPNSTFIDANKNYIVVTGERNSVKIASEMIEDHYEDLKINTRTINIEIPKRQHKYLIGQKGATLQEILETTGCTLELPPATDPSANVTIRGPQNQLSDALKIVTIKANSIHVQILDITDLHQMENPMKHSINILKYLWNRGKLKNVESKTGVKIVTQKLSSTETEMKNLVMEFVGKVPESVENARKEITEIIKNLPPSYFDVVEINPKFHRHVIGRKGQNLRRIKDAYGVEIIVPDEKEANSEVLIVFEGRKGDKGFSDRKKKELYIKEVIEKVKNELLKVERDSSSDFSVRTLAVPVKYHGHIIGPKGSNLNAIIDNGGGYSSISVKFGSSKSSSDRSLNTQQISDDSIIVKGPAKEVERIVQEINEKVEDTKRIESMKSFTVEFTIPAIYSSHIIGKGGSKIKFIRESYNVRIDIENNDFNKGNNGKEEDENVNVKIVGMKVYVEEARNRILDTIDKLQKESVVCVHIPPQYHASLIGAKGISVRNLEVKHSVRIKFPKNNNRKDHAITTPNISSEIDEDIEGGDDEREGEFKRELEGEDKDEDLGSDVQKLDEVLIIGGKRGVSEARSELLDLLHYAIDHDNVISFTIPAKCLPHVVGKNGRRIKEIKTDTFTKIDIGKPITLNVDDSCDDDNNNNNNNKLYEQVVKVNVRGNKRDNIKAQDKILEIVKEFEKQTTIIMNINPKHHKFLIGPSGNRIKEVITKAGGPQDKSAQAGIVKFPRLDGSSSRIDEVVIKGSKELVEKIKEEFEILIEEQENLMVDIIKVPRNEHSVIIGRNGSQIQYIQSKFNVKLYFPGSRSYNQIIATQKIEKGHQEELIDSNDLVKIVGKVEDIELAKGEILSKLRYEYVFKFPCKFYGVISNNGLTSRKLRNEYHVIIEYQVDEWRQTSTIINKKPNFKKSTKVDIEEVNDDDGDNDDNDDDDDEFNVDKFDFKIINNYDDDDNDDDDDDDDELKTVDKIENVEGKKSEEISWTLKGVKGQVDQAVKYLNELLEQAAHACTGYLSIPQIYHRHIIGRGGLTISNIRAESRCKIDVPKVNGDDIIVIIGSKENIMIAKNKISEVLINLRKEQNGRKY